MDSKLPEIDIHRLRDDILEEIRKPRIPRPPRPIPDPPPFAPRFDEIGFNPQPDPPSPLQIQTNVTNRLSEVAFNPQPEPPSPEAFENIQLRSLQANLTSSSTHLVRETLASNIRLLIPYLCLWPRWWRFRCDEVLVLETDNLGTLLRNHPLPLQRRQA